MRSASEDPGFQPASDPTRTAILTNISYHTHRLSSLQSLELELNYTPSSSSFSQYTPLLSHLSSQITQSEKNLHTLKVKTQKAYWDHVRSQNSTSMKVGALFKGRKGEYEYEERKRRDEVVYLEASRSRAEKAENERLEELKRVREETLAQKQQLEHKAEEYKRIKNELSSLYATIFDGPTPPFPEEDTFEHTLLTTHLHTESAQKDLNRHTHTSTLLQSALLALTISISLMKDVLRTSSGTIGFLHTSDGHSVQEAAKRFVEAQGYAEKARERCREVQRLKGICVGDMPFLAFAKSDRLRSDMYIYEKLATIARQLEDANDQIQRAHAESERRKVEAARVLAEVTSRRDTLELELFELRKSIVEKVIREDTEPPPYEPFENGRDG